MDFDIRAFWKTLWLGLRSHWLGLLAASGLIFIVVYPLLWGFAEPLGIPDLLNATLRLEDFVSPYGILHVLIALSLCLFITLAIELVFRRLTWASYGIKYQVHMEGEAWRQGWKFDGEIAGRPEEHKRVEAIRIRLGQDFPPGMSIEYQAYVEGDQEWQNWVCEKEYAGTTGQSKPLKAIKVKLENAPPGYGVVCRLFVASVGKSGKWQHWVSDEEATNSALERGKRIEAIRILVISPHRYGQFWKKEV